MFKLKPLKESLRIAIIYMLFGGIWILFSDTILNALVKDIVLSQKIQLIKGWLYVLVTGVYILMLIYVRLRKLYRATEIIEQTSLELQKNNDQLEINKRDLNKLAYYDSLTGLLNWLGLEKQIDEVELMKQKSFYGVIYFDIDNFKHVNETLGHVTGDLLLQEVAKRLEMVVDKEALIARLGGDEFMVISLLDASVEELIATSQKIVKAMETPFSINYADHYMTISLGIASFPLNGRNINDLIKNADIALYQMKVSGKAGINIYNDEMSLQTQNYVNTVRDLRIAIEENQFELYYQPIINHDTMELVGLEALIRWNHPGKGLIYPGDFIEISEESGQIYAIGEWVTGQVCFQYRDWVDRGFSPVKISFNVSGRRLVRDNMVAHLKENIKKYNVNVDYLQIEITETTILASFKQTVAKLKLIRNMGISIALDDFGTGYSSLTHLSQFPIDVLKLDKSFIQQALRSQLDFQESGDEIKAKSIIRALLMMAKETDIRVIAEGIETEEQRRYMIDHGCYYAQGYLYSRPISSQRIEELYLKSEEEK